jgi:hypothetical protein
MRAVAKLAFFSIAGAASVWGCRTDPAPPSAPPLPARYSGTYRDPLGAEVLPIGRALVQNQVTDCRSFAIDPNANDPREFKIRCTSDGRTFVYYVVRTDVKTMTRLSEDGSLPRQP